MRLIIDEKMYFYIKNFLIFDLNLFLIRNNLQNLFFQSFFDRIIQDVNYHLVISLNQGKEIYQ